MRIGILTFHRSYNYGAFLQCYSLVTRIQRDFPEDTVEVIDYMFDNNEGYRKALNAAHGIERKYMMNRNEQFEKVISYLPLSKERFVGGSIDELYHYIGENYDVVVVGSDAVFNWNGKGLPNAFLPCKIPENITLMSYAASAYGCPYKSIDEAGHRAVTSAISNFTYLGVRDSETERMLQQFVPQNKIFHNCDPTVFLDLSSLPIGRTSVEEKLWRKGIRTDSPIIGMMAAEPFGRGLKKHFGKDVQLVSVYKTNRYADFFLDDLNPFEWAQVFSFFDVTITHFFHGTMFSLKNGIPTIVTERASTYRKGYETKVQDLLSRLNCMEFYYPLNVQTDSYLAKAGLKLGLTDREYVHGMIERVEKYMSQARPKERLAMQMNNEEKNYDGFCMELQKLHR